MIVRTAGFGLGALGVGTLFASVGGLIKNPWAEGDEGKKAAVDVGLDPELPAARPSTCAATPAARKTSC